MQKRTLPKLTPPEFEIMEVVWKLGETTVTEIMEAVNAAGDKQLKRSTIQVQVLRLEEKGWLTHREDGKRFLFSTAVSKEEASAEIVRDVKERVFGGSCAELVKALFNHTEISPEEIKKLRNLINKYEE
jgi:predicted transcriptional regulator